MENKTRETREVVVVMKKAREREKQIANSQGNERSWLVDEAAVNTCDTSQLSVRNCIVGRIFEQFRSYEWMSQKMRRNNVNVAIYNFNYLLYDAM